MDWEPITKAPPLTIRPDGVGENRNLLVWIDDHHMKGFARGWCIGYADGRLAFGADNFNGDWNITHWHAVTPPNAAQVAQRWSQPGFAVVSDAGGAPIVHDFARTRAEATHEANEASKLPAHLRVGLRVVPAVVTFGDAA